MPVAWERLGAGGLNDQDLCGVRPAHVAALSRIGMGTEGNPVAKKYKKPLFLLLLHGERVSG
jgi:hypothetical protein